MGPRPDGRGTRGAWSFPQLPRSLQWGRDRMAAERREPFAETIRYVCFNGAATGWPRNAWGVVFSAIAPVASMGPRPDGRGTQGAVRRDHSVCLLQWGRDRMAAERALEFAQGTGCDASMGPRPDGRGTSVRALTSTPSALLQWGRDRMAAERFDPFTANADNVRFNGAATGWPRNAMAGRVWIQGRPASMGPRPDGRGTAPAPAAPSAPSMLQWGRDRMAAERLPPAAAALATRPCFNGAATGWPRNAYHIAGYAARVRASMGPRPDGRGTAPNALMSTRRVHSFNGAATGWPRNALSLFAGRP